MFCLLFKKHNTAKVKKKQHQRLSSQPCAVNANSYGHPVALPNMELCKLDVCIYMHVHICNKTCFEWTAMLLWCGLFSLANT